MLVREYNNNNDILKLIELYNKCFNENVRKIDTCVFRKYINKKRLFLISLFSLGIYYII